MDLLRRGYRRERSYEVLEKKMSSGLDGTTAAVAAYAKLNHCFMDRKLMSPLIVKTLLSCGGFWGRESVFSKGMASGCQALVSLTPGIYG